MRHIFILAVALMLTACAATAPMNVYSISDTELEQELLSKVSDFQAKGSLVGMPMELVVNDIGVTIGGEARPQSIGLNLDNTVFLQALALKVPLRVRVSLAAEPIYNNEDNSIYLNQLEVLNVEVDAMGYRGKVKPISNEVQQMLNDVLRSRPIYTLDQSDPTEALLSKFDLQLSIVENELTLKAGI